MPEISKGKPLNDLGSRPVNSHSTFNNNYNLGGTLRYGELTPHFIAPVVPDDKHRLVSKHSVRSYTLSAPLMEGIDMHKDYFYVPDSAILAKNYKYFITSPDIGEDVSSDVGTTVINLRSQFRSFDLGLDGKLESYDLSSDPDEIKEAWELMFIRLAFRNLVCSSGSLLAALDCHLYSRKDHWDDMYDVSINELNNYIGDGFRVEINRGLYYVRLDISSEIPSGYQVMSLRDFLDRILKGEPFLIRSVGDVASVVFDYGALKDVFFGKDLPYESEGVEIPTDLKPFFAYQLVCTHFFSNDHVDFLYSADLYRQNMRSLAESLNYTIPDFSLNGVRHEYDELSARVFTDLVLGSAYENFTVADFHNLYGFLANIFAFQNSLKFVDYFTGSRTHPLAIGDDGVVVNDNMVSVVDVLEKRWYVKLWNQINRVGHRMEEQIKGLFPGVETTTDWTEPVWLGSSKDTIFPEETDNTGSDQMNPDVPIPVTSSLVSNAEKYGFDMRVKDRYGFVIGITWFDMRRYYARTIARHFFYLDRYDMFNPFLQYVGDQKVYLNELLGDSLDPMSAFGYQGRNMEYKQRYSYAFGGFINDALPSMLPLADDEVTADTVYELSPDYIRSKPSELDRFYKSLSGWSQGTYFHFEVIFENIFESVRPMSYNPQID